MAATCIQGAEKALSRELKAIGATNIRLAKRAMTFEGDQEVMYKANLWLRTATRVLVPIKKFKAPNPNALYGRVKKMNWGRFFDVDKTFKIVGTVNSDKFDHSQFAMLKVKDAVADWFMERYKKRPSVDKDNPDIVIHVRIFDNEVEISLDSSGEPLFKRGYRRGTVNAPIKEDLAAMLLLTVGYDGSKPLHDVFCGSATILVEGAMIATKTPPAINRKEFCFKNWKDFDYQLWGKVKDEAINNIVTLEHSISGCDYSDEAFEIAKRNIAASGFEGQIEIIQETFSEYLEKPRSGIMMSNPPYGERLKVVDLGVLFRHLQSAFKDQPELEAYMIVGIGEGTRHLKRSKAVKKRILNGNIECNLIQCKTGG